MAIEVQIRLNDGIGGRQSGDVIAVKEIPCIWGAGEWLPDYAHIRIPIDRATFAPYHIRHDRFVDSDGIVWKRRSKYRIDLSLLSANIRNALVNNGFYEMKKLSDFTGAIVLKEYLNKGTRE